MQYNVFVKKRRETYNSASRAYTFSLSFSDFFAFHAKNHTHEARVTTPPRMYERVCGSPKPLSEMMIKVLHTIVINNAGRSVMIYGFLLIVI